MKFMQTLIDKDTEKAGNRELQKWFNKCGVAAVAILVFSSAFCLFIYTENTKLQAQIVDERNAHAQDLRENTTFIKSLLKTTNQ